MAVGHHHVHLTGGQTGHGSGVRVRLDHVLQIADALAVVLLEPQAGIDVAGGGGGAEDGPGGAVEIVPGQIFAGVDLGLQCLTLFAGTGQNDTAVIGAHILGVFLNSAVVPVGGVLGILVDGIAQRGEQHIAVIGEQDVVAAGDEADVGAAGAEGLAHSGVAGAHGHVDVLHVIALFQELCLKQLLQRLRGGGDLIRVGVGGEGDFQRGDLLHAGRVGVTVVICRGGLLTGTAGGEAQTQGQGQNSCKKLFHGIYLQI